MAPRDRALGRRPARLLGALRLPQRRRPLAGRAVRLLIGKRTTVPFPNPSLPLRPLSQRAPRLPAGQAGLRRHSPTFRHPSTLPTNEKRRPGRRLFKGIGRGLTWWSEFRPSPPIRRASDLPPGKSARVRKRAAKRRAPGLGPGSHTSSPRRVGEGAHGGEPKVLPRATYIIPPMSGIPAPAPAGVFSGASATIASVVRMFFAIDAAFCSAERVTIVGSVMPALTRSVTSPVSTFRPSPAFA